MNAAATAAAAKCEPGSVVVLTKREILQGRIDELDRALAQHQRKAIEAQAQWRTTQAELERERNTTLAALAEL